MSADEKQQRAQSLWVDETPVPLLDPDRASIPADGAAAFVSGRSTAGEFVSERMLRPSVRQRGAGWRRAVSFATGGLVSPGPSAAELRKRELIARVKTPLRGCRKVVFLSRKGGVGKTTTCLLTGHTFAAYRGDRVVALDANPDGGTLAQRVHRETTATLTSLLGDAKLIERYADIRGYTSQSSSRLEIIAADDDPRVSAPIGETQFQQAIGLLERHYNLVCIDTGPGVLGSVTRGALGAADQIVLISAPGLDEARAASATLDWLEENGYRELAAGAVAVLNALPPTRGPVDIDRTEEHFASRCRSCRRIPWDPHLMTGAEATLGQLRPETRQAYLELAAAIAAGFGDSTEGG